MNARPDCDHEGCKQQSDFIIFYYVINDGRLDTEFLKNGLLSCRGHVSKMYRAAATVGLEYKKIEKGLKLTAVDLTKPVKGCDWSTAKDLEDFHGQVRRELERQYKPRLIRGV